MTCEFCGDTGEVIIDHAPDDHEVEKCRICFPKAEFEYEVDDTIDDDL